MTAVTLAPCGLDPSTENVRCYVVSRRCAADSRSDSEPGVEIRYNRGVVLLRKRDLVRVGVNLAFSTIGTAEPPRLDLALPGAGYRRGRALRGRVVKLLGMVTEDAR